MWDVNNKLKNIILLHELFHYHNPALSYELDIIIGAYQSNVLMVIVVSSIVYIIVLRFPTEFDPSSEQHMFICHEGILFTLHFPSQFIVMQYEFKSYKNHTFFCSDIITKPI